MNKKVCVSEVFLIFVVKFAIIIKTYSLTKQSQYEKKTTTIITVVDGVADRNAGTR